MRPFPQAAVVDPGFSVGDLSEQRPPPGIAAIHLAVPRNLRSAARWTALAGDEAVLSMCSQLASAARDFPVVCVGGSAGGLDAYIRLLRHLPSDMGVAIVIVNHLRIVDTLLHEILPRYTVMPVELIGSPTFQVGSLGFISKYPVIIAEEKFTREAVEERARTADARPREPNEPKSASSEKAETSTSTARRPVETSSKAYTELVVDAPELSFCCL